MSPTLHRRSLLAGAATLPAAALAQPGAAPLRQRLAGLRLGANVERWFAIAANNQSRRLGPAWWRGFKAAGFDHVRFIIPPVRQTGGGHEVLDAFLTATNDAAGAGLPVLLALADTFYHSNPWQDDDWQALEDRARFFARQADPAMVALAPLNEPAFPDTATWLPMRDRLLGLVRRAAPRHVLLWGGREWCSPRSLVEAPPPADPNCVAEAHDYGGGGAQDVEERFRPLATWRERHGQPVLATELGGARGHEEDLPRWSEDLRASLPVLRRLRLPACLWSYTHGGHWRLQEGGGPALRPPLRAALD